MPDCRFHADSRALYRTTSAGSERLAAPGVWRPADLPGDARPLAPAAALARMQADPALRLRVPVGVIGPREEDPERNRVAEAAGRVLAQAGLTLICGGRTGVMEAASRGAAQVGGLVVGMLPGDDPAEANAFVSVPVATGIGEARNVIIARSAAALVAVGDSHGTLSEVALGLRFGKTVFGLCGAPALPEVVHLDGVEALVPALAGLFLGPG